MCIFEGGLSTFVEKGATCTSEALEDGWFTLTGGSTAVGDGGTTLGDGRATSRKDSISFRGGCGSLGSLLDGA